MDSPEEVIEIDINGRTFGVRPVGSRVLQSNNVAAEALAVPRDKPLEWATDFFFGNVELSLELWTIISGIRNMMQKRAGNAGLDHINPDQLRHTAVHYAKSEDDYKDADIIAQFGWRSGRSMDKYARSTAEEKAHDAHKRYSLGDRI